MSLVKSFSVGNGDMFYIRHNSDNFSIIDCCLPDDRREAILNEIDHRRSDKGIVRFISTHPDQDHMQGLVGLDDRLRLLNFYVVRNSATKDDETDDFKRYKELRGHHKKAFHIRRGCTRRWMNQNSNDRGSSGINIRWPILDNERFKEALKEAENGGSPNNISPVVTYNLEGGVRMTWMGDLETDFMESIDDAFTPDATHVLFAPHHGRKSGRVPNSWLDVMHPRLVVVGEAPSSDLDYYSGYDTITQNSAGDVTFQCLSTKTHIYVSNPSYAVDFLVQEDVQDNFGFYVGTFYA